MKYIRKSKEVEAIKLNEPVYSKDGKELAPAGYWLVTEDKKQYYMSDESFLTEFEIKPENPTWIPWYQPYTIPWTGTGTTDKVIIKDNTPYFSGDLPPGKFIFVKDEQQPEQISWGNFHITDGVTNIDELCKSIHLYTSNLDSSDLKVSFQAI